VILMGVHTNMCVLGRPFGIRQMVKQGKNVVLMRDLTDSMYNSRQPPKVSHFRGTELVVEHIEKYWCPTITSTDFTAQPAFRFSEDQRPHVVFLLNENLYHATETMPQFADALQQQFGHYVTLLTAEKNRGFATLDPLKSANLAVLFMRREPLPAKQLDQIRAYLDAGKPLVALRTASHAFSVHGQPPAGLSSWDAFDAEVLGGNYHNHYNGNLGADVQVASWSAYHPVLKGLDVGTKWHSQGDLYLVSPVSKDATCLLRGSIPGKPEEPLAWVRNYKKSRIFYTSLGHPADFEQPLFTRLLTNAVAWALEAEPAKPRNVARVQKSGGALSPAEAAKCFTTPADLELEQVLAEPHVTQPVFLNFDERGRMWVVEYRQYPFPAGLKILSEDKFLRATYDKVPPPPPHHFRGEDRVSVHEDTDGDGRYDKHTTFVEGLNIVSAIEHGRGGLWVLNPPYLLFYPDRNHDDVPDGDPEVHLQGFGLEDTHSVVNSLQFGPDGWLYAAQGSTVSGDVLRPGRDKQPVHSLGQLIWRYHPEQRRYEIFAEGGGNAFGLEIDAHGRIFSGHNGGDTRGFHYVQGGYYQKGFAKHGPLSNPYTFGYFGAMKHDKVPRFTHCTIIYEGGALPEAYNGKLFGVHPLMSHVVYSRLDRDGSTFKTEDLGHAIDSTDHWFRPVDIKVGPDGAIYVADMYEGQIAHLLHHEGQIDKTNGRIYRLKAKGAAPLAPFDLSKRSPAELVELLRSPNKWFRRAALRLLGDRPDPALAPQLLRKLEDDKGMTSLELLWAIHACGGFNESVALKTLAHSNPFVRLWTVRLLGDEAKELSPPLADRLVALARGESNVEVRSQLACTARRLPAAQDLPIVRELLAHGEDLDDPHVPLLLWWAIEAKAESDRDAVLALFEDSSLWKQPLVAQHVLERLMRRYAQAGTRKDLLTCARLLKLSPDDTASKKLMRGFEEAFQGRSVANLPEELVEALARLGGQSVSLGLRRGQPAAVAEALNVIGNERADANQRLQYIQILGEVRQPSCVPVLLGVVTGSTDEGLKMAALTALESYDAPDIAVTVLSAYDKFTDDVRAVAQTLLVSRKSSALELLAAVEKGRIDARSIPLDVVRKMTVHRDPRLVDGVKRVWGSVEGATSAAMRDQIARLQDVIADGEGSPYAGKKLFTASCAKCHRLFGQGGQIGPDLTSFKRDDVRNMLTNIVNPSAEIREGFETYTALTDDGRVVTGFLVERDNQVVVLRGIDGQNIALAQDQIEQLASERKSLMPEGQLQALSDQQVRDLFAYLRSSQPLSD
jgi:putative heme-binding domain-containing protein